MFASRFLLKAASILRFSLLAIFCWALLSGSAVAAKVTVISGDSGKGWVVSYLLIGLFVFLGLAAVLRPVGRTTDVKRTKED